MYVRPTFLACQHTVCGFWGFHSGVAQDSILLGYESMGNQIQAFLGSVVTLSSGVKMSKQTFWDHYIASKFGIQYLSIISKKITKVLYFRSRS